MSAAPINDGSVLVDRIMAVMDAAFDPAYGEAWNRRQITDALVLPSTHALIDRPEPGRPGPLGENVGVPAQPGFTVNVPVLADYAELEPVLLRELQKLGASGLLRDKGFNIQVDFQSVTIYPTENNRLAVGVEARVRSIPSSSST